MEEERRRSAGSPVAERYGRARSPPRAEAAVRKPSTEATPVPRRLHAIQVTVCLPAPTLCTTSTPRQYAYGGIRVLTVPRV